MPRRARSVLLPVALVLAAASLAAGGPPGAELPAEAEAALAAFRTVPWGERLKPVRPDPAPPEWRTRLAAEWALAALDPPHAAALAGLLRDEDRFVRALGARSLGICGGKEATPALVEALAKERDKVVRMALVEALGRTGGEGALAAVESQATPGADRDVGFAVGIARRQLKGGRWDVDSLRAEHAEALRAGTEPRAEVGAPAPELALPSPTGPVNLSTRRGRIVVLVFSLGDRSDKGAGVLQRLGGQLPALEELGAEVVVVDPHEKERTAAWAARMRLPARFTFASDPAGRAQAAYGVARQIHLGGEWLPSPAWFVVDPEGELVWARVGTRDGDEPGLGELLPVLDRVNRGIVPR